VALPRTGVLRWSWQPLILTLRHALSAGTGWVASQCHFRFDQQLAGQPHQIGPNAAVPLHHSWHPVVCTHAPWALMVCLWATAGRWPHRAGVMPTSARKQHQYRPVGIYTSASVCCSGPLIHTGSGIWTRSPPESLLGFRRDISLRLLWAVNTRYKPMKNPAVASARVRMLEKKNLALGHPLCWWRGVHC